MDIDTADVVKAALALLLAWLVLRALSVLLHALAVAAGVTLVVLAVGAAAYWYLKKR
ncbi:hypothetical protein [Halarchaeum sp. P4]|uniref:hypothetical protein n=1 Tax=Halarchaeum sp. P4 TaxID=3421639 RepID=UPI003EBC9922